MSRYPSDGISGTAVASAVRGVKFLDVLLVTCGALEHDVDEKSFVTCTEAQAEIKVRVGRVFHVNQVFGVEYVVSVLVFVLDVAGGQCGIALSVLIERPVVNLFLRLEQAFASYIDIPCCCVPHGAG